MKGKLDPKIAGMFRNSFEHICLKLLTEAYKSALIDGTYDVDWKENNFTLYLAAQMRKLPLANTQNVFVKVQVQPDNDEILKDMTVDADEQPVIDIWLANWFAEQRNEYYIEAKNLCEKDWSKKSMAKVSASKQRRRYIDTGIANFISKRYPDGCLAGYVLQGIEDDCVNGINRLLEKDGRKKEVLEKKELLDDFEATYVSQHETLSLKHLMLKF